MRVGGSTGDAGGLEIRVKAFDAGGQERPEPIGFSPEPANITDSSGRFGFGINADDPDTPEREGASPGDEIRFFLVRADGTGEAITKKPQIVDSGKRVDIVLVPQSREFIQDRPFPVDIKVKPNGQPVSQVATFLNFSTGDLEVVDITPGTTLETLSITYDNTKGTIDYAAFTPQTPPTAEFVLATVALKPERPVRKTAIVFNQDYPRKADVSFGAISVLRSLAGLELVGLVQAATSITPVLYKPLTLTNLNLSIFGPPTNIRCKVALDTDCAAPENFSKNPMPTFTWTPPTGDDVTGPVVSFEVRIVPDQAAFTSAGNTTIFTHAIAIPEGPHTFQVRAVGAGDRQDAVGSLDFFITVLPGDVNGDDVVNTTDLRIVMAVFNTSPPSDPRANLNEDMVVDIRDLVIVALKFGRRTPL